MIELQNLEEAKSKLKLLTEWSDRLGSDENDEIGQILILLQKQKTYLEELSKRCIIWSTDDFISQAEQRWDFVAFLPTNPKYHNATKWQDVYDETQFEYALEEMIRKHDSDYGISWSSVDYYLDEYCLKK